MSDSDDFGGLAPTTPIAPVKAKAPARKMGKPTSSLAGPSSHPVRSSRKKPTTERSDSDVQEIDVDDKSTLQEDPSDDGEVVIQNVVPPPRSRKPASSRTESSATNAKPTAKAKGKGKARAGTFKTGRKPSNTAEPVDVDEVQVVDDTDMEDVAEDLANAINVAGREWGTTSMQSKRNDTNARTLEQLRRAEAQIEKLTIQLEEALQIRESEAEALRQQQEAQYQEQIRAQESLIKDLTAQLGRSQPLVRPGKTSVLHLMTREAADGEMEQLLKENENYKALMKEASTRRAEDSERIAELEQIEKELRLELKLEIERAKEMANAPRHPSSVPRSRTVLGSDDPKHREVIKFYEDLTNLLVPSIKLSKGKYFDLDEWIFTCVYTFNESNDSKSLNFLLRFSYDLAVGAESPPTSKEELVASIHYIPMSLEKEPEDFVENLEFLNKPFTFERTQLSIFLRTIYDSLKDMKGRDDDSGDESVQIIG